MTQPFARELRWRMVANAGLDDVGSAQVRPVDSGEVVEGQQSSRSRAGTRWPWGTCPRSVRSVVEGARGRGAGLGHPDLLQALLRLRLTGLGQVVEDVAGLVHPAALAAGPRIDLRQRRPEAQRAVKELIEAAVAIEGGTIDAKTGSVETGRIENSIAAYIAWMAPRIVEMKRVLKPSGSIYLHCDPAANSYLRLLLDAVFGRENFRNEIVWQRRYGTSSQVHAAIKFGVGNDNILFYAKSAKTTFQTQYSFDDPGDQEYVKKTFRHKDKHGRFTA